jgi:hypothetical protein
MLTYIHQACGKPAFMLTRWPRPELPAQSKEVLHLNYHPVEPFSIPRCDSCGEPVPLHTCNIRTMI